jgi:hypothetical protein
MQLGSFLEKILSKQSPTHLGKATKVGYKVDYSEGEKAGCSCQIVIADRIFYVKHFAGNPSRYFSGDPQGVIQKEISRNEFELWLNVLADSEIDEAEIQRKLGLGKKY